LGCEEVCITLPGADANVRGRNAAMITKRRPTQVHLKSRLSLDLLNCTERVKAE
jgi:hypothetical protein